MHKGKGRSKEGLESGVKKWRRRQTRKKRAAGEQTTMDKDVCMGREIPMSSCRQGVYVYLWYCAFTSTLSRTLCLSFTFFSFSIHVLPFSSDHFSSTPLTKKNKINVNSHSSSPPNSSPVPLLLSSSLLLSSLSSHSPFHSSFFSLLPPFFTHALTHSTPSRSSFLLSFPLFFSRTSHS